jgi:hypothetical protein
MMSFDVKMVTKVTSAYKAVNNANCPPRFLRKTVWASHRKNPVSSKNIDKIVIDKNNTKIFTGSPSDCTTPNYTPRNPTRSSTRPRVGGIPPKKPRGWAGFFRRSLLRLLRLWRLALFFAFAGDKIHNNHKRNQQQYQQDY